MLDCFWVSLLSSCHYKRKTFLDLAWTFKLKCWTCFSAADSGSSYIVSMKPLPLRPLGIADWITVMLSVIGRDQLQRGGLKFQLIHSSSGYGSQIPRITLLLLWCQVQLASLAVFYSRERSSMCYEVCAHRACIRLTFADLRVHMVTASSHWASIIRSETRQMHLLSHRITH